jgi:hypothetical protein
MSRDLDGYGSLDLAGLILVLLCVAVIVLGDIVAGARRLRARLKHERKGGRTHV